MKKDILEKNTKEYYLSAMECLGKKRYNSSTVLFFKCLFSLADYYLLIKLSATPSSHKKRFEMLRNEDESIYDMLDKTFSFYIDSYVQVMDEEIVEIIKNDCETLARKVSIRL